MKRRFTVKGKSYIATLSKEDGEKTYFVECKELHSFTQGRTIKSSLDNIKEASALMLEVENDKTSYHFGY